MRRLREATGATTAGGSNNNISSSQASPLRVALQCDDRQTLRALLRVRRHEVNNTTDHREGLTLLHEACLREDVELVELLLEHGADPSVQDGAGRTARDLLLDSDTDASEVLRERLEQAAVAFDKKCLELSLQQGVAAVDYSALCPREVLNIQGMLSDLGGFITISEAAASPTSQP